MGGVVADEIGMFFTELLHSNWENNAEESNISENIYIK